MGTRAELKEIGGGFTLIEVVVALALLAISLLGVAGVLEAAVRRAGAAVHARQALAAAVAVAATSDAAALYPAGWRLVGASGPDAIAATVDDPVPESGGDLRCWRRVRILQEPSARWLVIEADCGGDPRRDGADALGEPSSSLLARKVRLMVLLP